MADEIPFTPPAPQQNLPPVPKQQSFFSGFSFGGLAASLALDRATAMFKPHRSIGLIIADVTIEETGRDDLEITRHPVEIGAQITDHSYKQPAEIIIRCGWSNSGSLPGYVQSVHDALLELQGTRQPFAVTTGKRTYPVMLMASLTITTDSTTENALMASVVCREIILVQTRTTQFAPRGQQSQPQSTGATESTGNKQPIAAPNVSGAQQFFKMMGGSGAGFTRGF